MNRKIAAWTIAAVAVLGLTACSGAPSASDEGSDEITSSEAPAENTAEDTGDQSVADACKVATEDITAATASPALRTSSKLAMMQRASWGFGMSLTVTSVVTASMPSLPITAASRS